MARLSAPTKHIDFAPQPPALLGDTWRYGSKLTVIPDNPPAEPCAEVGRRTNTPCTPHMTSFGQPTF